jgi:TetR/AcrR family transcriptional regulator, ethionamide resistance regulator
MPSPASRARVTARLLETLQSMLADNESFTEISVEALMDMAGMSRRTFYVYFADKGGLIRGVAAQVMDMMIDSSPSWADIPATPPPTQEDVQRMLTAMATAYNPHRSLMRTIAEAATHDEEVAHIYRSRLRGVAEQLHRHIVEGQRGGTVDPSIDGPIAAEWLTALMSRTFAELPTSDDLRESHLAAATAILWRTLYHRQAA